ncbi:MAG: hypothetical protein IKH09_05115 [Clostridia bacterium]|nr:hypothetical protein [Clostridia bacterium]
MKRKALTALATAILLAALILVFASCSNNESAPATSGEESVSEITLPKYDPTVTLANDQEEALAEYYALKEGDLSQLGKYWYGTVSEKITAEGARMESELYGRRLYHYAAPIVVLREKLDEMVAKAEEDHKDDRDPSFEFVKVKLFGFYALKELDPNLNEDQKNELIREMRDEYSIDVTKTNDVYVLDPNVSPDRMKELEGYFTEYFGYTLEDARDDAREAGMADADLIGTVDPYFVFEYSDRGDIVSSVEYSDEALERLEALCRELKDGNGEPLCYGKYEYVPIDRQYAQYDEDFRMLQDEYKKCTGDELLELYKITLREKKTGETSALTGEYRAYSREERTTTVFDVIFVHTSRGWEAETIAFPWGGSARRLLLDYSAAIKEPEGVIE